MSPGNSPKVLDYSTVKVASTEKKKVVELRFLYEYFKLALKITNIFFFFKTVENAAKQTKEKLIRFVNIESTLSCGVQQTNVYQ